MNQRILLLVALSIILLSGHCQAKDTLYWQKVNWPPYQILQGEDAGKGRFDVYIDLFQEQLPQYEHKDVEMNWTRFWEDVKAGKHVLNSMAIKTEERSQFAAFSKPISFALPHRIIMKRSTLEKLGNPESIALADFLKDRRFRGILEQKRSYSVQLDEILNKKETDANIERKAIGVELVLKMLLSGRADYTIEYPVVVDYLTNRNRLQNDSPLSSVRIEELPRYIPAYIAAPKNDWGLRVISDLDNMIDGLKTTDRYLEIQKMYHSDPGELNDIQDIYEELFLNSRPSVIISGIINTQVHDLITEVLQEAYKRIDHDVQFKLLPAKRSLDLANLGKTDGDIGRIEGTDKVFPNLIAVPTPVFNLKGYTFTKAVTREISKWSDLKGLRIGVVRGIRYATIGTKGLDPFFAEDITHLFRLLADDRIDVAVAGLRSGTIEIQKNFGARGFHTVGKPLYTGFMYHFVHKKNRELVPRLNKVLSEMAAQGEIDTIVDQTFQKMLKNAQSNY